MAKSRKTNYGIFTKNKGTNNKKNKAQLPHIYQKQKTFINNSFMEIIIDAQSANQRFDRFLRKYCKQYPDVSLTEIYKGIRKGFIKINAKKTKENSILKEGDVVLIKDMFELGKHNPNASKTIKDRQKEHINRRKIRKRIIDETPDRLVRNKPAGIVMHESAQHYKDLCMHDYLDEYLKQIDKKLVIASEAEHSAAIQDNKKPEASSQEPGANTFKPSFGYRLDKDTSGVLIAAKTYNALQYINKIIRDRKIDKYYMTIVAGEFPQTFQSNKALEKTYNQTTDKAEVKVSENKGKESLTQARCHSTRQHPELGNISLVKVKIGTGRMHQIRVHLADAGYPILGDILYGNQLINRKLSKHCKIHRQLLHCRNYSFYDEANKTTRSREAQLPEEFIQIGSPML